jgi:hypothetical protein
VVALDRSLIITVGPLKFIAELETRAAPRTCQAFVKLLPLERDLLQARWSGEAAWVPLGNLDLGLGRENATSHPCPGQLLFYPLDISETEILFPYGEARFGSKHGELHGNHFLTIVSGQEKLPEVGRLVVWQGAQKIRIERDGSRRSNA